MGEQRIQLGLLDFSWVNEDQSPVQALKDTVAVAQRAEALGYARYWLGEHHVEGHACGSPQIFAALLAASTKRIRIGIGAMLLQYWAPLKLAEDFCLLEAIFGRVDLGVGRGLADNFRSHLALLDGRLGNKGMLGEKEYEARLNELVGHLRGTIPEDHPHRGAAVIPDLDVSPEIWVCGSTMAAPQAARTGTRFCCSLFHGRIASPSHMVRYRDEFRPSLSRIRTTCRALSGHQSNAKRGSNGSVRNTASMSSSFWTLRPIERAASNRLSFWHWHSS
jgi:luciferase family oxidoreductase group 1